MSSDMEHKGTAGGDKDPFAQLSMSIERNVRKKKALNDDDLHQHQAESVKQQAQDVADPAQSKASSAAAAVLMSHWSEQKAPTTPPIDTLTTADRQRMMDKRRVINDPKKSDKTEKNDEPSKSQSHE